MSIIEALFWLTLNVYHEARSEPEIGQIAIVHVTLNRARQQRLPIKDIVTKPHQFSWTRQKNKSNYIPNNTKVFIDCLHAVYVALQTPDITQGATHYHLDSITPYWTHEYIYIGQFGSHKFYKEQSKALARKQKNILSGGL